MAAASANAAGRMAKNICGHVFVMRAAPHAWDPRKTAWPPLSWPRALAIDSRRASLVACRWDGIGAKVVAVQQNLVKPRSCDVNENVISESCRTEYGISEEQLKNAVPLEQVIDQFSQWARARLEAEAGGQFYFVTDGQLTLRQALHPEAVRHGILLPDTFYHFFDLRKEFQAFYGKAVDSVQDMLACILGDDSGRELPQVAWRIRTPPRWFI
ncbi:hypothetical protein HPB50_017177 [Hyalomma asiaticum]|uniref:Uncharacterized protein n=1 Tax=Hyalomma asiaticum TaxID=266040 RepID=A0ACB7TJP5_HYAAI|nr:hypothetical protein HPB50_017177 [Hyalomma asiaticum]